MPRNKVLVVDDELNITELIMLGLRYEGFDVTSACDGHGALRAVRPQTPAVAGTRAGGLRFSVSMITRQGRLESR